MHRTGSFDAPRPLVSMEECINHQTTTTVVTAIPLLQLLLQPLAQLLQLLLLESKIVPYSITSTGLGASPGFLAVSPQVT